MSRRVIFNSGKKFKAKKLKNVKSLTDPAKTLKIQIPLRYLDAFALDFDHINNNNNKDVRFNPIRIREPRCSLETPTEALRAPAPEGEGQRWPGRGRGEPQTGDEDGNGTNQRAW
jgi:hypothetical protein